MNTTLTMRGESVRLDRRALFDVPDISGLQLACGEGCLWVTLDNDPRDIVLEAGESFYTTEHKRALVYALEASRFTLLEAEARRAEDVPRWRDRAVLGVAG